MNIDSHVHFWRYNAPDYPWIGDRMAAIRRDFLPSDVRREMDRARIGACVAVQARQTLEETRWLLHLAETNPFIIGVVGWIDLQADDVGSQLQQFAHNSKLIGLRHIVQDEADDRFLLRPAFCRGISQLEDLNLTYDILIYPKHLRVTADFVARFRRQTFVLDHLAKPDIRSREMREWEKGLRTLAGFPHVFCKVSGLITEAAWDSWTEDDIWPYLDIAFDCFGSHRLLVGSDWPVCTLAADYERTIRLVSDYLSRRPAAERQAVMSDNAIRLWNLTAGELV